MKCSVLKSYIETETYKSVAVKQNFKSEFQGQDIDALLFNALENSDSFKDARKLLAECMTETGLKQLSSRFAKYKYSQTKRKEKSHLYVSKTVLKKLNAAQKQLGTKSHDDLLEYLVEGGHQWSNEMEELQHTKNLAAIFALLPNEIKETLFAKFEKIAEQYFYAGVASVSKENRKSKVNLADTERQFDDKLLESKVAEWDIGSS